VLSALYAAVARRRRERYASRPDLRQRLQNPVISVGNLAVGGRGKSPVAACIARMLVEVGERPAILSRGYRRADNHDEVVVVRDAEGMRADLARSGDEPLMLARQLPGAVVVVSKDRYRAGRVAEQDLGATVHVLDDGFQHLRLDRDIDLVIVGREDIANPVTLPGGRLREPLDTIVAADAILIADDDVVIEARGAELPQYRLERAGSFAPVDSCPALAVAGIASPERFIDDLRRHHWTLAGTMMFADHHRYTARDVDRMVDQARRTSAARIVTTEKDYVRLLPFRPFAVPVTHVTLTVTPQPFDRFREFVTTELRTVRGGVSG
jgi:tetraacyldisaccharide 4'-kinase